MKFVFMFCKFQLIWVDTPIVYNILYIGTCVFHYLELQNLNDHPNQSCSTPQTTSAGNNSLAQ